MGTYRLIPHPEFPPNGVDAITVDLAVQDDELWLRYSVAGDAFAVALPEPASPVRTDGLWQTTCFEAFIRQNPAAGTPYSEYNFAPSGEWAAYCFADYRQGMAHLDLLSPPYITLDGASDGFIVEATIPLPEGTEGASLGLTAVIEELDGTKSFWALVHPDGKPDFHNPACFVAQVPAPTLP